MSDLGRFMEDGVGVPIPFNLRVPSNMTRFTIFTKDELGNVYSNIQVKVTSPSGVQYVTSDVNGIATFFGVVGAYTFESTVSYVGITGTKSVTSTGGDTINITLFTTDASKRYAILASGNVKFAKHITKVDIFLVGGGGGSTYSYRSAGGGGGGGYTKTVLNKSVTFGTSYAAVIGAGGSSSVNGGTTTFLGESVGGGTSVGAAAQYAGSNGGNGGSGGHANGGNNYDHNGGGTGVNGDSGSNTYDYYETLLRSGGSGQGTTTKEFGSPTGTLYASGGGFPSVSSGGAAANTGNGAPTTLSKSTSGGVSISGGSGIIVVIWA